MEGSSGENFSLTDGLTMIITAVILWGIWTISKRQGRGLHFPLLLNALFFMEIFPGHLFLGVHVSRSFVFIFSG